MPSLFPKSAVLVRPRIAVEVRPEGVFAASAAESAAPLSTISSMALSAGAVVPSLRVGNLVDRVAVIAALRKVLGAVQTGKQRDVTLVLPDTAVRVLLLDFDELPSKQEEALPVLRFRLAKLLPFPPDLAQISYQVMSRHALVLQVLVVAVPNEVLAEYESAVREAGFEPGAVLPSTLAVAAALDEDGQAAALLVNGSESAVTTAILRRGEVLLHRTLELKSNAMAEAAAVVALEPASRAAAAQAGDGTEVAVAEMLQRGVLADAPAADTAQEELLQAISVAAAYFEDSLAIAPTELFTAGTLEPAALEAMLEGSGLQVRQVVQAPDLLNATPVPHGLLAGVRGALRG